MSENSSDEVVGPGVPDAPAATAKKKKKCLSEDQWANLIAGNFLLPEKSGVVTHSLVWENATSCFWKYEGGWWKSLKEIDMTFLIRRRVMMSEPFTMNRGKDIYRQMVDEVPRYDVLDDGWIAFRDGSWFPDTGELAAHSPSRFATVNVDADFRSLPDWRSAPLFSKFVTDICVAEDLKPSAEMLSLVQEMFGYCLMSSSARAVSFFLSGEGRNGKGVLLDLLRHVMSHDRVSNMSLSDLTSSRFATSVLVGMRLNIADETSTSREAVSDMFKKLVATDTISAERKFGDAFQYKPRCKYLFNVNGVPSFDSFGHAMKERIIPIPFFRTFSETERNYTLGEDMKRSEMAFVLSFAVEGLVRLKRANFVFTKFAASTDLLDQFEHLSDPLAEFLSEWEKSDVPMPFKDFYLAYSDWCKENGRKVASSLRVSLRVAGKFGRVKKMWYPGTTNSVAAVPLVKKKTGVEPAAVAPLPDF